MAWTFSTMASASKGEQLSPLIISLLNCVSKVFALSRSQCAKFVLLIIGSSWRGQFPGVGFHRLPVALRAPSRRWKPILPAAQSRHAILHNHRGRAEGSLGQSEGRRSLATA